MLKPIIIASENSRFYEKPISSKDLTMTGRSVESLKIEYSDVEWRRKYCEIFDLMEILGDCIIGDDYVVPNAINSAIKLTLAGQSVQDRLARREKVNAKDARLMCALAVGRSELYIDVEATDVEQLCAAINDEITSRTVHFPFVFGRELYDKYAESYEDEKDVLSTEETIKLLAALPQGVCQYGAFTVGPYGLKRSTSFRDIRSRRRVPAYHCSVTSCQTLHSVILQTSQTAPINRDRGKFEDLVDLDEHEPAEWWKLADNLRGMDGARYADQRIGVLLPLLGDALSDEELRSLVAAVLDAPGGQLRKSLHDMVEVNEARAFVATINRAELLQILLISNEDVVASALDSLVQSKEIIVPRGEIRRPVVNNRVRSGAFNLRAELGNHGIRFVSDDPGLAVLRERRLLRKLYVRDNQADAQELDWQLRGIDAEDLDEKMESYFRSKDPFEALQRLVLARKSNVITASHEVGLENYSDLPDAVLLEAILWKLGFPLDVDEDPHEAFWKSHEQLSALAQSSAMGVSERFLEIAGRYFVLLEGLLLDSLAFTAWALLSDHTASERPFSYDNEHDRTGGLTLLHAMSSSGRSDEKFAPNFLAERVELRNLIEGFRTLAKHLAGCRETLDQYARPSGEFPDFDGKTELKNFVLRSTVPFLDLSGPSQERIIQALMSVAEMMTKAEVFSVRNDYAHYRRNAPDVDKVEKALEAIGRSVTRLEHLGFSRITFLPNGVKSDRWGQVRHEFVGPRSYEHSFSRPTTLDWMGLPGLDEPQYLMRAASFDDPNEVLRFTRRHNSQFSEMWNEFPNRRTRGVMPGDDEIVPEYGESVEIEKL